jgi:copper chaperone CopZ
MKNLIVIALTLAIASLACEKNEQHKMQMSQSSHVMINVPTIQCSNCVKIITDALKKVDGIDSVKIDLEKKIAHINFHPEKINVDDIRKAIAGAGYDADNVKRNEKAYNALPECCQIKD